MDMFGKLTSLFQQALETREPSIDLLQSFVEHWKGITNYYIATTDDMTPARETDIPWRLRQMLDILVFEERQQEPQETGPCMEYLLQHKILETLCTLAKAQYPPGMTQQVLAFFSKLLAQIQQPLLHIINIYRPVQKLIWLCARPGSQTEKEEAQFLFVVCSRLKQDPYVLNYILECKKDVPARKPSTSEDMSSSEKCEAQTAQETLLGSHCVAGGPLDNTSLIYALMHLTKSQKSKVALKAHESLVLVTSLPSEETAVCLAERTALCEVVAGRLSELHVQVPATLDPADIYSFPQKPWRNQFTHNGLEPALFPGSGHLEAFLSWLDFCNDLVKETHKTLSLKLSRAIRHQWLDAAMQPQLLQMSEVGVLLTTSLLSRAVRLISAPVLLEELVLFLLGDEVHPELQGETGVPMLRSHLIDHCDHISDEISLSTLRLFEELLQKPHPHITYSLVIRNLERRGYLAPHDDRPLGETGPLEESEELEEDPFFTDMYTEGDTGRPSQQHRACEPRGGTQLSNVVHSFLCLVPQEAKTSHLIQGGGYDTYVHDAHELFKECKTLTCGWGWPGTPALQDPMCGDFYEGHFLKMLFDRTIRILEQPYELNLQVTSLLARVALFPHPHLHEYMLDPYICLSPGTRSLFSVLVRVIGDLMQRTQHIPNFTGKLIHVRNQLIGQEPETLMDHMTLLKGVIVLEEFCKELAAIAFVKLPMEEH